MAIHVNGEVTHIPLEQLIAEGKEIAERGGLEPKTQGLNSDLWFASIAVSRYDEAHRRWSEANEDGHIQRLRNQAQENVRMLKASGKAKLID